MIGVGVDHSAVCYASSVPHAGGNGLPQVGALIVRILRAVAIGLATILVCPVEPSAGQGIPKGPAADREIDRVLGPGTADALNKVDRTCESLTTFVRLFLSHTDAGNYAEAYKLMAKDSKAVGSAATLGAYVEANLAFRKQHKRPEMFDCALDRTERGGTITVPVTADAGEKFTIEFEVVDRVNRLSIRRIFSGKTFP